MESSKLKTEVSAADFEMETQHLDLQSKIRQSRIVEIAGLTLTSLTLIAGVAILGLSADALKVYNATHVPADFLLPLWPDNVDLRPTHALVAAGSIAVALSVVVLLASKVHSLRSHALIGTGTALIAPAITFVAAVVAIGLSYAVNSSGDTVHNWTCHWRSVPMQARPHFGTLCAEGEVALGLTVLLVPLELIVVGVAAYGAILRRRVDSMVAEMESRKGSPALS